MSSILAHQVLMVLQIPIQATQHKDDTLPKAYLLFVLFRVLHQAQAPLFSHTSTTPRGYSLHKVPHSCDSPLNECRMSLNQDVLHLGIPRMHSGPSLAQGKHVAFIHYLHHHLLMVTTLCLWDFCHIFLTLYSPGALALLRATISHAYNQSIGGEFIKRTSNF